MNESDSVFSFEYQIVAEFGMEGKENMYLRVLLGIVLGECYFVWVVNVFRIFFIFFEKISIFSGKNVTN